MECWILPIYVASISCPKEAGESLCFLWSERACSTCQILWQDMANCPIALLERGGYCHAQDAIVYADGGSWKVAQVQFHVILHEMHCTFVQPWCLQKCHFEKQCAKFKPSDLQGLILLQSILYPVVFCKDKDEATVTPTFPNLQPEVKKHSLLFKSWEPWVAIIDPI